VQKHYNSLREGLRVNKEARTHWLWLEIKVRRIRGVFLILSFIIIIAQFESNTVNFDDCVRLVLFQSLEKAKDLHI